MATTLESSALRAPQTRKRQLIACSGFCLFQMIWWPDKIICRYIWGSWTQSRHWESACKHPNSAGVGSCSHFQGIFPAQELNSGLLHFRRILYQLSHKWSSRILEWVDYPFSSRSPWLRNRNRISCVAGRFFNNWATSEALVRWTLRFKENSQEGAHLWVEVKGMAQHLCTTSNQKVGMEGREEYSLSSWAHLSHPWF